MAWNIEADLKQVGENLRRVRNERKLAIDAVAKAVKLSPKELQRLEEGLYPECRITTLFDLIEFYGVRGEDIFGKKAEK